MAPNWFRRNRTSLAGALLLAAVVFVALLPHRFPYRDYPGTWAQRFVDSGLWRGGFGGAFRAVLTSAERATDRVTGPFMERGVSYPSGTVSPATETIRAVFMVWEGVSEPSLNRALEARRLPHLARLLNRGVRRELSTAGWTTVDAAFDAVLLTDPGDALRSLPVEEADGAEDSGGLATAPRGLAPEITRRGFRLVALDPVGRLATGGPAHGAAETLFPRHVHLPLLGGGRATLTPGQPGAGVPLASVLLLAGLSIVAAFVGSRGRNQARKGGARIRRGGGSARRRSEVPGIAVLGCLAFVLLAFLNGLYLLRPGAFLQSRYQAHRILNQKVEPDWSRALAARPNWEVLLSVHPEARLFEAAFPGDEAVRRQVLESLDRRLGRILEVAGEDNPVLVLIPWEMTGHRRMLSAENWAEWARGQWGLSAEDPVAFEPLPVWGGATLAIRSNNWDMAVAGNRPLREALRELAGSMADSMTGQRCILAHRLIDDATAWIDFGPEYWVTRNLDWMAWRYSTRFLPPERNRPLYEETETSQPIIRRLSRHWAETAGPSPGGFLFAAGFPRTAFGGLRPVERDQVAREFLLALPERADAP